MAGFLLLQDGVSYFILQDGTSHLLLNDAASTPYAGVIAAYLNSWSLGMVYV